MTETTKTALYFAVITLVGYLYNKYKKMPLIIEQEVDLEKVSPKSLYPNPADYDEEHLGIGA